MRGKTKLGFSLALILACTLLTTACSPLEQKARDTAAGLGGALTAAQGQYQTACTATPTLQVCKLINGGIAAQNALIIATEAYCGFTPASGATAPCVPVKTATGALQVAIANATPFITELKAVIQ